MRRLSESRFNSLFLVVVLWLGIASAQDPFGEVLASNSQLWKSFQEEMRTLEQAAHRVNSLLTNVNNPKTPADQDGSSAENPLDVTVLANPGEMKNGIPTKVEEAKLGKNEKKEETTEGGVRPSLSSHFGLGPLFNSFGFIKAFPEPWWKGKNVCVEKSEKVEEKNKDEKEDLDKHLIIMGTGTFEHCKQTAGKYICTTVISTPQSTKTVSTTYQCCEGFRREAEGCVQGEVPPPVTTLTQKESIDIKPEPERLPDKDAIPQQQYKSAYFNKMSEESSFSSQSGEGNDKTLEQWRRFKWNRLK